MRKLGENVIRIEAEALRALADRIAGPMGDAFEQVVAMLDACTGRVVVTGMGKCGIIARKIAATLSSTGTPSVFMHPSEALHGDLGMLVAGDVVLALSNSGETEEIVALLGTMKRLQVKLVTMTCDPVASSPGAGGARANSKLSTLASAADIALDCSIAQEACGMGLAPTASTTTMLALGDALALALADKRGFREEDFANLHPGGKLGKKLSRVAQLMHSGDALPRVTAETRMAQVIYEMSRKKLGMTTVVRGEELAGIISDGDLRRLLEKHGHERDSGGPSNLKDVLDLTAEDCMTRSPKTVAANEFAVSALNMMERDKITFLVVVDEENHLQGIIHLHDLWGLESI